MEACPVWESREFLAFVLCCLGVVKIESIVITTPRHGMRVRSNLDLADLSVQIADGSKRGKCGKTEKRRWFIDGTWADSKSKHLSTTNGKQKKILVLFIGRDLAAHQLEYAGIVKIDRRWLERGIMSGKRRSDGPIGGPAKKVKADHDAAFVDGAIVRLVVKDFL